MYSTLYTKCGLFSVDITALLPFFLFLYPFLPPSTSYHPLQVTHLIPTTLRFDFIAILGIMGLVTNPWKIGVTYFSELNRFLQDNLWKQAARKSLTVQVASNQDMCVSIKGSHQRGPHGSPTLLTHFPLLSHHFRGFHLAPERSRTFAASQTNTDLGLPSSPKAVLQRMGWESGGGESYKNLKFTGLLEHL